MDDAGERQAANPTNSEVLLGSSSRGEKVLEFTLQFVKWALYSVAGLLIGFGAVVLYYYFFLKDALDWSMVGGP